MKNSAKEEKVKEGSPKANTKTTVLQKPGELKTDFPLSEKDEVKQAEEKMRKRRKKQP